MSEPKAAALCIPASRVREVLGDLQGFVGLPTVNPYDALRSLTAGDACRFLPREETLSELYYGGITKYSCENDGNYKQAIVYLLLVRDGRILTYHRHSSGGEGRLHAMRSCGLGGHVEECDLVGHPPKWMSAPAWAAARELREETQGSLRDMPAFSMSLIGFINDDSDPKNEAAKGKVPVGRVHLGLLYLVTLSPTAAPRFALEIADPQWQDPDAIDPAGYEGWSRIALEAIKDGRIGL